MKKIVKKVSITICSLLLFLSLFGGKADAAMTEVSEQIEIKVELEDYPTNEELFSGYVEKVLYGDLYEDSSSYGSLGSSRLKTKESRAVYAALKEQIEKIAAGELESTEIQVIGKLSWTAEELGIRDWFKDDYVSLAVEKFSKVVDMDSILKYLLIDCPYELYWFDKTESSYTSLGLQADLDRNTVSISPLIIKMPVEAEYQKGNIYKMNTSLAKKAKEVKVKATDIVAQNNGKTAYQKLLAYKDVVCEMTDYNYSVATNTPYGNPWQLIWVFDGNPATKVVCEGYTKAFQYLCDLSGLECYIVTGVLQGGTGYGAHMWNIVKLHGKNYLVDVTNCDKGNIGYPNKLFLAGTNQGSVENGYTFPLSVNVYYGYDFNQSALLGKDILRLESKTYVPVETDENPTFEGAFSDVPATAWYTQAVKYVYDNGLMSGSYGVFKPKESVTRSVVVTTLYRMAGSPKVTDYSACDVFQDVKAGKWYTDAICWAYKTGVTTGNPSTMKFDVSGSVTRQQLAAFFFRYAELAGMNTSIRGDISQMLNADQVKTYSLDAVQWAVGVGLISGSEVKGPDGNPVKDLAPLNGASRAQLATILQRFCEE